MPTIAIFYGIVIQMYWRDHGPPHLHAFYQGFEALIAMEYQGRLSVAGFRPAPCGWCAIGSLERRVPLMENWQTGAGSYTLRTYSRTGRRRMIDIVEDHKGGKIGRLSSSLALFRWDGRRARFIGHCRRGRSDGGALKDPPCFLLASFLNMAPSLGRTGIRSSIRLLCTTR